MTILRRHAKAGVASVLTAVMLAGCAMEGVELNGKIFDALGVSTASLGPRPEPKMERRSPIVLPPNGERLPEPGSEPAPALAENQNWPKDRDQQRVAAAAEAKQKQQEYCRDGNWKEKAMKDEVAAERNAPGGNCGSIFAVFSKGLFGAQD